MGWDSDQMRVPPPSRHPAASPARAPSSLQVGGAEAEGVAWKGPSPMPALIPEWRCRFSPPVVRAPGDSSSIVPVSGFWCPGCGSAGDSCPLSFNPWYWALHRRKSHS